MPDLKVIRVVKIGVRKSQLNIMRYLIEKGANLELQDKKGQLPKDFIYKSDTSNRFNDVDAVRNILKMEEKRKLRKLLEKEFTEQHEMESQMDALERQREKMTMKAEYGKEKDEMMSQMDELAREWERRT